MHDLLTEFVACRVIRIMSAGDHKGMQRSQKRACTYKYLVPRPPSNADLVLQIAIDTVQVLILFPNFSSS